MTNHSRRLKALECLQRGPASLEAARRFWANLHKVYGPPDTPAPALLDEELKGLPAQLDAAIDQIYGESDGPQP